MTSPIFDSLAAQREATPVFLSLARGLDDPRRAFESPSQSQSPRRRQRQRQSQSQSQNQTPTPTSNREAVTAVATWPLRAVPG